MPQLTTIELFKSYLEFSAGHFTIFSATEREKMHGHNFMIYAAITAEINHNGIVFDYGIYRKKLAEFSKELNGRFLLPGKSPYFRIEEQDDCYYGYFNDEKMPFSKRDVLILPLRNITIEELAHWFLMRLLEDKATMDQYKIRAMLIKVSSARGIEASAQWEKSAISLSAEKIDA